MALTTAGLTNGGVTTHYKIQYDDSLSAADGKDRANALIAVCEADYNLMSGWFGGIALTVGTPVTVNISPGGYASASWGPPITLTPGNGSSLTIVRYLLVSEVTEMFMLAQGKGWFGSGNEGSAGEGLSRFLAGQFLIANGLGVTEPGFALANSWMTSPRADYVNNIDVLDHGIDAKTGCAILFIYYLHVQLGFSINSIIAAAASELAGVYKNLTGDSTDPFPNFKKLLDDTYPGTTSIPGANPDNPFPIFDNSFWQELDNNPASIAVVPDGGNLYQLHNTGKIWKYVGPPLTGWQELDNNPASKQIAASSGVLYQLHNTGKIWKYVGPPLTGWQNIDTNPASIAIVADGGNLYQLHNTGKIWKYTGTPITGWQELDNNPATKAIAASGGNLYQLHSTGKIWKYTGTPLTGWQNIDTNPASIAIVADGGNLYQLHNTGKIWKYTGIPITGWQELDNNPATVAIAAGGGHLYQLHKTGLIWRYIGTPLTGWRNLDNNPATKAIAASGGNLYQLHNTGKIWKYTGA
jgi:hypothetical protein